MKKKYKILGAVYYFVVALILSNYSNISNIATKVNNGLNFVKCGSAENIPRPIPQITTIIYSLLIVGTPIILIIFSIITLIKAHSSGSAEEMDKSKKIVLKKFIIAALIFFIGFFVKFIINQLTSNEDDKNTASTCLKCFLYYSLDNCEYSEPDHEDPGTRKKTGYASNWINSNIKSNVSSNSNSNNPSSGYIPGQINGNSFVNYKDDYMILNIREGWDNFYNRMRSNYVYEASNPSLYADKCLSFAYYHAHSYYTGDYTGYASAANNYARASHFKSYSNDSKEVILKRVYEELSKNKPVILHVSGTSMTSRHYVTVVGVKKTADPANLQETDFIQFDSYQGDVTVVGTRRKMITGAACHKPDYTGYQIYYLVD